MIDKTPKRPKPDPQAAEALDRGADEGGDAARMFSQPFGPSIDKLAASERHILECLGAAVVLEWNRLSTDVQRAIFRHASTSGEAYDPAELKVRIARFLHDHKNDAVKQ